VKPLAVEATGMITGLGNDSASSCAAIRCSIDRFEETSFRDQSGEWIIGSQACLDPPLRGRKKLIHLAASAIFECLPALGKTPPSEVPLLLCVAEPDRPGRFAGLDDTFLRDVSASLQVTFHRSSQVIAGGRVGGAQAIAQASALLEKGRPFCLVSGVDTFLVGATLSAMESRQRLLTTDNSNGLIPGEAGAALLLCPNDPSKPRFVCSGIGFGTETATIDSEEPLRGVGLSQAIQAALADGNCTFDDVDYHLSDANGEQYRFKETALALARSIKVVKQEFRAWHTADCIGEVGAASVPCAVAYARAAALKGYAPGLGTLAHFGNDSGERAALVLRYFDREAV
jgi:3-oxoacyl-[acyl-carrier-protein] synthase-1